MARSILTILMRNENVNPCAADCVFVSIFIHLKMELLTQFPVLNDKKYVYL